MIDVILILAGLAFAVAGSVANNWLEYVVGAWFFGIGLVRILPMEPYMSIPLNDRQYYLLKWLSEKENSMLIECDGPDLHHLINHGLAKVQRAPFGNAPMFSRVSLTAEGRELLDDGQLPLFEK